MDQPQINAQALIDAAGMRGVTLADDPDGLRLLSIFERPGWLKAWGFAIQACEDVLNLVGGLALDVAEEDFM
jgi:hypothetical protein